MTHKTMDRRSFLRYSGWAALGSVMPFRGIAQAAPTTGSDYKALVCLFLYGGNDSNNMIVPLDDRYKLYASSRSGLALPQSSILALGQSGYGVHPSMPASQALFNSGDLAVVSNMGPLVQPVTRSQVLNRTAVTPDNLNSHPDQRNCMFTSLKSSGWNSGWGGRMIEAMGDTVSGVVPSSISTYGETPFINGTHTSGFLPPPLGSACDYACNYSSEVAKLPSNITLIQAEQQIYSQRDLFNQAYEAAMASASPTSVYFPNTGVGTQLQLVSQIISVRNQLSSGRQIFFVGVQGFDTHADQYDQHAVLLAQIDGAIGSFSQAMEALNVADQVTLFTLSEFTRTLQMNSSGGSDHGWGGHHLVTGGAVKGGKIYGSFPTLELGGPDDLAESGAWIPTSSLNQYGSTLASWFGVSSSLLTEVFPDLGNFSVFNLGFV